MRRAVKTPSSGQDPATVASNSKQLQITGLWAVLCKSMQLTVRHGWRNASEALILTIELLTTAGFMESSISTGDPSML